MALQLFCSDETAGDWNDGGCQNIGWLFELGLKLWTVLLPGKPSLMKAPALPGMQAAIAARFHPSVVLPMEEVPAMNLTWKELMVLGFTAGGNEIVKLLIVLLLGKWKLVSL
jgi:hypothetical protein